MVKFARYILGAGLIFGATAAMAGDLPPEMAEGVMNTCRADYHRLCSDVVPGDGRAARCLLDNQRELAPPCLKAVKLAYAIHACMPDIHRYCEGVPRGPQAFGCLAERMDMLRPECRRVITANAPYMMPPGGERYGYNGGGQGPYGGPAHIALANMALTPMPSPTPPMTAAIRLRTGRLRGPAMAMAMPRRRRHAGAKGTAMRRRVNAKATRIATRKNEAGRARGRTMTVMPAVRAAIAMALLARTRIANPPGRRAGSARSIGGCCAEAAKAVDTPGRNL